MTNKDFLLAKSYLEQAKIIINREGRGEEYIEDVLDGLSDLIFDFEQGYLNEESEFIPNENPYCQADFI